MPENHYAIFSTALHGFEEPDTNSPLEGLVQPGSYRILEQRLHFPAPDTDYARIEVPALGDDDTWICIRWKHHEYARVESRISKSLPVPDFSGDELAIEEHYLVDLLPQFYSFSYDLDQARYPYPLSGLAVPLAPPYTNNCCTFVEALVAGAWQNAHGVSWNREKHAQMMIFSRDDYFSPVSCLVGSQMAVAAANAEDGPSSWIVVQGWRNQWQSGHTFIILAHHPDTDRVLTLESNASYRLNGVGYRMIGNLKQFPKPPQQWWQQPDLWTWERIKSVYRYRSLCHLKVLNPVWTS